MAVAAGTAIPAPVEAQGRRRQQPQNLQRVLIVPPLPADPADSAFSLVFADEARKRLAGRARNQVRVIETDQYCEALEASGFNCSTLLDVNSAEQLARFLEADAFVVSQLRRESSAPLVDIRMIDIGRSGLAGLMTVRGQTGDDAKHFAQVVGDSLRNQVRAADLVRQCGERRDRSDFRGARDRAERAFNIYPDHPAAALCVSYLFEATQQPTDSLIWAYRKAVAGDSLFERGWERLGRLYLQVGDTAASIEAFIGQLRADPFNQELRNGIVAQKILLGDFDGALELVDEGIALTSGELTFLQLKARTCSDSERWDCALDAFNAQFAVDSELARDTVFLAQIIGAADLGHDTTEATRWTGIAVSNFPNSVPFRMAHASWLKDGGLTDSALAVYRGVLDLDPENTRAPLAMAQVFVEGLVIDSTVPLDTAAMATADSIMSSVGERTATDETIRRSLGVMYFQPGIRLAQLRSHPRLAAHWLERSLDYALDRRFQPQANFFLGFMTVLYLGDLFTETRDSESCEMVQQFADAVNRGKNAMDAGRSVSPPTAETLLARYAQMEEVIPQFEAAFECK